MLRATGGVCGPESQFAEAVRLCPKALRAIHHWMAFVGTTNHDGSAL